MAEVVVAYIINAVITMAAAYVVSSALQAVGIIPRTRKSNSLDVRGLQTTLRSNVEPHRLIYGRMMVSGPLAFFGTEGSSNDFLHLVVVLAAHECDAIEEVYLNDTPLGTLDASGYVTQGAYYLTNRPSDRYATVGINPSLSTQTVSLGFTASYVTPQVTAGGGDADAYTVKFTCTLVSGGTQVRLDVIGGSAIGVVPTTVIAGFQLYCQQSGTKALVRVEKFLGGAGQAASPQLIAAFPSQWTSAHVGAGLTYLHLTLQYDPNAFASGIPNVKALVRGRKVIDPRTSTTAWTDNSALCIRDYYLDQTYGMRYTAAELSASDWVAAANTCDELVTIAADGQTLSDGTVIGTDTTGQAAVFAAWYTATAALGTVSKSGANYQQKRYRLAACLQTSDEPGTILGNMLATCAGVRTTVGGLPAIRVGAYRVPTVTLADKDTRGPVSIQPRMAMRDLASVVQGTYLDPLNQYVSADYPPIVNASYTASDGGDKYTATLALDMVPDKFQAMRLAKIRLEQLRAAATISIPAKLAALDATVGETVGLTLSYLGYSGKVFRVKDWKLATDIGVDLVAVEDGAGIYDWALGAQTIGRLTPGSTLPDARVVAAPTFASIVSDDTQLIKQADGTITPQVRVTINTITDGNVINGGRVELQWLSAADLTGNRPGWTPFGPLTGGQAVAYAVGPKEGDYLLIRARAVNALGSYSAWTQTTHTVIGKAAAPPNPTSLTVTTTAALKRRFSIVLPATLPLDIAGFVLRSASGNVSTWASMTWFDDGTLTAADAGRTVVVEFDDPPAGTWSFACKLVDTSGNESAAAVFASNLALGAQPVDGSRSFNLLKNSHWTEYTGTNDGIAALKDWAQYHDASITDLSIKRAWQITGVQPGRLWNCGAGGMWLKDATAVGGAVYSEVTQTAVANPGQTYEAAFVGSAHRCKLALILMFFDSGGTMLAAAGDTQDAGAAILGGETPSTYNLWWLTATAPANTATMVLSIRKSTTNTGSGDSYAFANYAYLGPAPAGVTRSTRTPWSAAGVSQLHGGGLLDGTVDTLPLAVGAATDVYTFSNDGPVTLTKASNLLGVLSGLTPSVDCNGLFTLTMTYTVSTTSETNIPTTKIYVDGSTGGSTAYQLGAADGVTRSLTMTGRYALSGGSPHSFSIALDGPIANTWKPVTVQSIVGRVEVVKR